MNIGIDARLLSTKVRGIYKYVAKIIEFVPRFDNENNYFVFQYEDLPADNAFYNYIKIPRSKLPRQLYEHFWLNFKLPGLIKKNSIDIFFTPYMFVPFYKGKWKNVIVIHDALTKVCKEYFSFHYRKYLDLLVPASIRRSDAIITISKSALNDIINYYPVSPDKIRYLHHWTDEIFRPAEIPENEKNKILKKYNIPAQYILFVSVLEERKNLRGILKVSDMLTSQSIDIKFVLVGREGFGFNKIRNEIQLRKERIIVLQNVDSDSDLVALYNLARIFFFPTHYEGFGLPPLEAMKCGVPVVTSNNSSLPEVVGKGGIMGDADDYEFFANSIKKLLEDEKFYGLMKNKAIEQAKKFNPNDHILNLTKIFNSLK
ncbi:MAG TPA: glycosyltransferase family 1 protein [Ignavibacteriaceae bacterium]|nr:glycosyltransferase family 1 protein [Ignavibacteriaceae bacterium]